MNKKIVAIIITVILLGSCRPETQKTIDLSLDNSKTPKKLIFDEKLFLDFHTNMSISEYCRNVYQLFMKEKIKVNVASGMNLNYDLSKSTEDILKEKASEFFPMSDNNVLFPIENTYYDFSLGNDLGKFESEFWPEFTDQTKKLKSLFITLKFNETNEQAIDEIFTEVLEMYLEKYGTISTKELNYSFKRYYIYKWKYRYIDISISLSKDKPDTDNNDYTIFIRYDDRNLEERNNIENNQNKNKQVESTKNDI